MIPSAPFSTCGRSGRERRRRDHRRCRRRWRSRRALVALRSGSGDPRMVRWMAWSSRERSPGRAVLAAQAAGPTRLCRLALHRDRRTGCAGRLQTGHRRGRGSGCRLHRPLHWRSRRLFAVFDRKRRARPRQSRGRRPDGDEVRVGRLGQSQGVARHLGLGQGIGVVDRVRSATEYVDLLAEQYAAAKATLCAS